MNANHLSEKPHCHHLARQILTITLVGVMWVGMTRVAFSAGPLPPNYTPPRFSDVDKTHEDQEDLSGAFIGIDANETDRCWQASYANMLYQLGIIDTPQETYGYFTHSAFWPNAALNISDIVAYYNVSLGNFHANYHATGYGNPLTPSFARSELFRGQAVELIVRGFSADPNLAHAITFEGWKGDNSVIADSDADWFRADQWPCPDSAETDGWHLDICAHDVLVIGLITVCPIPEPSALALLTLGLMGFLVHRPARRKIRLGH